MVIAGKVQIAQQAAVVPPRLDSSHKGNCHCHEGPYMVWQNVGNDIGSRAILLAVSLEVFQGQKLDRFNLVVITNSRLKVRVSYQLA